MQAKREEEAKESKKRKGHYLGKRSDAKDGRGRKAG